MKTVNIHRVDPYNVGDMYSTPTKYFDFLRNTKIVDIWDKNTISMLGNNIVIVGGGGLISNKDFAAQMNVIARSKPKKLICWGAGHNVHHSQKIELPEYLHNYDLVGVRDYGYGYEWTPCPSCLHPAFDRKYAIKHEVVIYEHPSFADIPIGDFPKLTNRECDFERVIAFLGSGETILTSTYHGVYWGTLLNRKVVAIKPFSSKFYGLKHKIPIANMTDWKSKIKIARKYPETLAECRGANVEFAKQVKDTLNEI